MRPEAASDRSARHHERVGQVMRRDFVSVAAGETLREALGIMRMARLRHMFVERNGHLVGILTYRDLQDREIERLEGRASHGRPTEVAVEDAMREAPHMVTADTPLPIAAARMARLGVGCLAVVERTNQEARLLGLVTERDLLRNAYPLP